ncbi:MAG: DUF1905 domain-containing protein [Bdellovibrionales bacterium CG10_big_fil_rev_8_21_14_0_10_45_34]|nr:MAG: DUF1905 domain-containing protein [Bdellovibrionales bacterium CG10_big_fil_rev_8_21_14_0_10_45_34]
MTSKITSGPYSKYKFRGHVWKHKGHGGWFFVTLPRSLSLKIRKDHGLSEEGWGRLKATAKLGKTSWATAIWYDSKVQSYLLPLKASVRRFEGIESKAIVSLELKFEMADRQ